MRHSHDDSHRSHPHHGRGGEHHGGGGRRQRFFGHGELRLVILEILTRNASHGYELIKDKTHFKTKEIPHRADHHPCVLFPVAVTTTNLNSNT